MNYTLLTNSTYLYLLKNPTAEIVYTTIAKEVHLTRQTVAKEYQYLVNNNIDYTQNELGIINFYFEVPSPTERAICIFLDLVGTTTLEETAKQLGLANSTVALYYKSAKSRVTAQNAERMTRSGVYALLANNEIIYIGSSCNLENRKKQH